MSTCLNGRDMQRIGIAFLVIVLMLLSPVLIPFAIVIAAVSHKRYLRRLHAAAGQFACPACGEILGAEAIRLADAACGEYMQQFYERGVRPRVVRRLHAICARCGARYTFMEAERTFVACPVARQP
jgi:hypothetical protein